MTRFYSNGQSLFTSQPLVHKIKKTLTTRNPTQKGFTQGDVNYMRNEGQSPIYNMTNVVASHNHHSIDTSFRRYFMIVRYAVCLIPTPKDFICEPSPYISSIFLITSLRPSLSLHIDGPYWFLYLDQHSLIQFELH